MAKIFQHLDEMRRVMFWRLDEFILIMLSAGFGLFSSHFLSMILAGLVVCHLVYIPLKRKIGRKRMMGFIYWHLPSFVKHHNFPASYKRKMRG